MAALMAELDRGGVAPLITIENELDEIERARSAFVQALDGIALRPGMVADRVRRLAERSVRANVPFDARTKQNCPAIAMTNEDFQEILLLLLENATGMAAAGARGDTVFEFEASEDVRDAVVLRVVDSFRWMEHRGLEGGLARIRQICADFGAVLFHPRRRRGSGGDDMDEVWEPLTIRFRAWPMGAGNEPAR